jgi:hypothetical protein
MSCGGAAGDRPTTLRQKLFPSGSALLPDDHPGADHRGRKNPADFDG